MRHVKEGFLCSLAVFLGAAFLPDATRADVFTEDISIGALNTSYEGHAIVVSNATLTVDGAHHFASLLVGDNGRVTHTFYSNGAPAISIPVTNESLILTSAASAALANADVLTNTIVVTSVDGSVFYTNDVDYSVQVAGGNVAQLQLTTNSAIADGATVEVSYTYQFTPSPGLNLSFAGDVRVSPGGSIDADGIGYGPDSGPGAGAHSSLTYFDGSGAGHGGYGGNSSSNAPGGGSYDAWIQPATPGSGGGSSYAGAGGAGGGFIQISALGNVVMDGSISARGGDAEASRAGGGAGGSISIQAASFSGSGALNADGGAGDPAHGGGGGGGRILLQCATNSFAGAITAYGGIGWANGGAGTIYAQVSGQNGALQIDNGGLVTTNTPLALTNTPDVFITGGANVAGSASWNAGNLTISSNSGLFAPAQTLFVLTATNLTIQAGAIVSANHAGSPPNSGVGAGHSYALSPSYPCGGGAYGGAGAAGSITNATGGAPYGLQSSPSALGSGGGHLLPNSIGGSGGGAIKLTAISLVVDGSISADGGNGSGTGGGGGAGGSLWITATNILGRGSFSADGGAGAGTAGGGGGGGRIAIFAGATSFHGKIDARGGGGANWGGAGTILLQTTGFNPTNQLTLDNGGNRGGMTLLQTSPLTDVLVTNGAVGAPQNGSTFRNLVIRSNSFLGLGAGAVGSLNLQCNGSVTIDQGGGIVADAVSSAYFGGFGAGGFSTSFPYPGSGGGNAGPGGNSVSNIVIGGAVVYSPTQGYSGAGLPGGGYSPYSVGGVGGGVLQLTVQQALVNNGIISANGGAGTGSGGGGGAGGSLNLTAVTISGSGAMSANGGSGAGNIGGGGGGGAVLLAFNSNSFNGTISAYGGGGANSGGAGFIEFKTNQTGGIKLIIDNNGAAAPPSPLNITGIQVDLTLRHGAAAYLSAGASYGNVTLSSNASLILSNAATAITLTINRNLVVQSNAFITSDGFGYSSAAGPSPGRPGTLASLYPCGGGAHGGYGGAGNPGATPGGSAYDNFLAPTQAGSGGGSYTTFSIGGYGGGAVRLNVTGNFQLDGSLSANGAGGLGIGGGGGGGGSINIATGGFSGAGSLSANGGNGVSGIGGGGGGGCIAISFTSNSFAGAISAAGGSGANWGGPGAIYFHTNLTGKALLVLDNGGHVGPSTPLPLGGQYSLTLRNGAAASLDSGTSVILGNLLIQSNGWLHPGRSENIAVLNCATATIQAGGGVGADGYGAAPGAGNGAGRSASDSRFFSCSGGSYGGFGAAGSSNVLGGGAYGSSSNPSGPGSGGGGYTPYSSGGSGGGGLTFQITGLLQVDGAISANGSDGSGSGGGGGSGGSILLTVGGLAGSGSISANGGSGAAHGGGGGGGRIAANFTSNAFAGHFSAYGGGGANWGGAGTIYSKTNSQAFAQLNIDNGGNSGTNTMFDNQTMDIVVQGNAVAVAPVSSATFRTLRVRTNSALVSQPFTVETSIVSLGDFTVEAGGLLSADSRGYGTESGPGAGKHIAGFTGGGGYGGYGGGSVFDGGVYGAANLPNDVGSGGVRSPTGAGASGGGGWRITVNYPATLTLNGAITANGGASDFGGGGAGGGIQINAPVFTGSGLIAAIGGTSGAGGGGGGGRIAVYCISNRFTGQYTATGGDGVLAGGAGTVALGSFFQQGQVDKLFIDNAGLMGAPTLLNATNANYNLMSLTLSGGAVVEPLMPLPLLSNLVINPGAMLASLAPTSTLTVTVLRTASIAAGGSISADAAGFPQTNGPGLGLSGAGEGSGGGYGGIGGATHGGVAGGTNYGSATQPADFGSGGGAGSGGAAGGSEGGGAIRLMVGGTLDLEGSLTAEGGAALQDNAGGGSGGSLWLSANALTGAGSITANGAPGEFHGGGGAGGRIALYIPSNSWTGLITANGAGLGQSGSVNFSTNAENFAVIGQSPAGTSSAAVSAVDLTFNEMVDPNDAAHWTISLTGPAGAVTGLAATVSGSATTHLTFPEQTAPGAYGLHFAGNDIFGATVDYSGAFTLVSPTISGTVTDTNGQPVAGVTVAATNGASATTDANGMYVLSLPPGYTGSVTPSHGPALFVPSSRYYSNVGAAITNENYSMYASLSPALQPGATNGNLSLNWTGVAGVSYDVQSSTNLIDWSLLYTVGGSNGPMSFALPSTNDPAMFYRLRVNN
ncbi:MAG TPA: carboxypeptidase-like regulatory domain-containing protein [Verrucomicrobiae bacterium]|nr:carboxypeptidase-like regulatory domain-containing protein [Verrucomicrobiae bacterium]